MISRWLHFQILLLSVNSQITRAQYAYLPSSGSSSIHSNAKMSGPHHVMTGTMLDSIDTSLRSKTVT